MEMGGAAGVDHQPVGRIAGDHGRVEPQRPERQTLESCRVFAWDRHRGSAGPGRAPAPGWPACRDEGPRARAAALAAVTTRRGPSRPTRTSGASGGGAAAPSLRRSRSVGQVGRKSETTRWHRTPPASKSAHSPARLRISSTSQRARPMPGTGSGADGRAVTRQRVTDAVGCPKSAASVARRQRRTAMPIVPERLGGELQPARGGHRQARHLGHHRRPARHAAGLPRKQASTVCSSPASTWITRSGMQPGLAQGRREQVGPGHAPEHHAVGAGDDPGREQRRCRTVDRAIGATGHLMQGTERQPAVRQACIDGRHPERQHASAHTTVPPRSGRCARAARRTRGEAAWLVGASWLMVTYVLFLFSMRSVAVNRAYRRKCRKTGEKAVHKPRKTGVIRKDSGT